MQSAPYATTVNLLRARSHRSIIELTQKLIVAVVVEDRSGSDRSVLHEWSWERMQNFFRRPLFAHGVAYCGVFLLIFTLHAMGLLHENWAWAMGGLQETPTSLTKNSVALIVSKNSSADVASALGRTSSLERMPSAVDSSVGIYLTVASLEQERFRTNTLDRFQTVGGNALVFEAKGGKAYFQTDSSIALEYDLTDPYSDLPRIIKEAHDRGLTVIARYVALRDGLLAAANPSTRIPYAGTKIPMEGEWVDAADPIVLEYTRQLMRDLLQYDIDEVNFDYIRYPTDYDQQAIGQSGEERGIRIERYLRAARQVIDEVRPQTKLGISTFAILGWPHYEQNLAVIGQDIVRFAPLVDVISPMAYPISFTVETYYNPAKHGHTAAYWLVYRTLKGYEEKLGPAHARKIRPWIQGYGLTVHEMSQEIKGVYGAGYCGFMVWNAGNLYEQAYQAMKKAGDRPEHCL